MILEVQNQSKFSCDRVIKVFDRVFFTKYRTRLVSGGDEPLYLPYNHSARYARIIFNRDYFASALHEVAHWCIAGRERRKQKDFGYWYAPDGRTQEQQRQFEIVEVKPQALEWIFSMAAGFKFRLSADNLNCDVGPSLEFKKNVWSQVQTYCKGGLGERPKEFAMALAIEFHQDCPFDSARYLIDDI